MYPLIETISVVDGVLQNLEWHQKRYEDSYAKMYSKNTRVGIAQGIVIPLGCNHGHFKLRISYNELSQKNEFEKYISKPINSLKIVIADNLEYELKYADRNNLNKLVEYKNKCDDILIIKNGNVTDASYANIVFTDGEKWFTPITPLLKGTCRARLLAEESIEEIDIRLKDLSKYVGFNLINAMNDLDKTTYIKIENIIH